MRTIALAAALTAMIPALQAGAFPRATPASPHVFRSGAVVGMRPGAFANQDSSAGAAARDSLSLEARQLQGAEAIAVDGTASPNAPVTITLLAIVSSDVPTIVVSRHQIVADAGGRFGTVVPIAAAYERGTVLRVVATSTRDAGSASAQLVTGAPNDGVDVPLEH